MDILKILKESGEELYPDDLDFFETELDTGGNYDDEYQKECRKIIYSLRKWSKGKQDNHDTPVSSERHGDREESGAGVFVNLSDVAPSELNPALSSMTPVQLLLRELGEMRDTDGYKDKFKKYVTDKPEIDEKFIETHYSFFTKWEIDALLSAKQFSEEFLEKYFGALDSDKIARYQKFSESFYMKHFSDLDAAVVLKQGKNEWRKKANRSKQLDVFLRLKGITF